MKEDQKGERRARGRWPACAEGPPAEPSGPPGANKKAQERQRRLWMQRDESWKQKGLREREGRL